MQCESAGKPDFFGFFENLLFLNVFCKNSRAPATYHVVCLDEFTRSSHVSRQVLDDFTRSSHVTRRVFEQVLMLRPRIVRVACEVERHWH